MVSTGLAPELSPDRLIELVDKATSTATRRYKPLDITEAEKLSTSFRFWRQFFLGDRATVRALQARIRLEKAFALSLQRADEYIDAVQGLPERVLPLWLPDVALVKRCKASITKLFPADFDFEALNRLKRDRPPFTWHFIAGTLAAEITQAMQVTNPGYGSGLGSTSAPGPTARAMAAVIPKITGEHPQPRTITSHLAKQISRWKSFFHRP